MPIPGMESNVRNILSLNLLLMIPKPKVNLGKD